MDHFRDMKFKLYNFYIFLFTFEAKIHFLNMNLAELNFN